MSIYGRSEVERLYDEYVARIEREVDLGLLPEDTEVMGFDEFYWGYADSCREY